MQWRAPSRPLGDVGAMLKQQFYHRRRALMNTLIQQSFPRRNVLLDVVRFCAGDQQNSRQRQVICRHREADGCLAQRVRLVDVSPGRDHDETVLSSHMYVCPLIS